MADFEIIYSGTDRIEWLKLRRQGIGASEAAAVLGESSYASPVSVFAEKLSDDEPDDDESERMAWGKKLEGTIIDEFTRRLDRATERAGELLRSTRWPFMMCTLDARQWTQLFGEDDPPKDPWFPLEAKNSTDSDIWGDGIPRSVWVQIQHQLAVTGKPWGSVAVLLWGCEFKWCDVPRNDEFIEKTLVPRCREFWDRVEAGGPPPPADGHKETAKALAKIFPQTSRKSVVLPGEFTDLSHELEMMKPRMKADVERRRLLENRFKERIGSANSCLLPNGDSYTWNTNVKGVRKFLFKKGTQS